LPAPRINTRMIKTRVPMTLAQGKDLITRATMRNADGTIGGYITVNNPQGKRVPVYIKDLNMVWAEETMELNQLEGKYDITPTTIVSTNPAYPLIITESGYDAVNIEDLLGWFDLVNGYLVIYSQDGQQVMNPVKYEKIEIDGVLYPNENDFRNALLSIYN